MTRRRTDTSTGICQILPGRQQRHGDNTVQVFETGFAALQRHVVEFPGVSQQAIRTSTQL